MLVISLFSSYFLTAYIIYVAILNKIKSGSISIPVYKYSILNTTHSDKYLNYLLCIIIMINNSRCFNFLSKYSI